jgi:cysteate synthase
MNSEEKYKIKCPVCGAEYPDTGFSISCDEDHGPALLRSIYSRKKFNIHDGMPGIFRFADWLPGTGDFDNGSSPVTYHSEGFGKHLGLENLWISFNGYWPERGASMMTCSFKELEAAASASRYLAEARRRLIVVASAGNTARAFAQVCTSQKIPLMLIVPASALGSLWLAQNAGENVILAGVRYIDYSEAIEIADRVCEVNGFINEGGAHNIARRDGMGTVLLDYVAETGVLPDHYFQAVGSGTGGISAWEANLRLLDDGRFSGNKVKLHLSQNYPFCPIYNAWEAGSRDILPLSKEVARERLKKVDAAVLSNRMPPYSPAGGVYDALKDTGGQVYSVTNEELHAAKQIFEKLEGIDICSAAAVAVASLSQAIAQNKINKKDHVLLNITGGGEDRIRCDHDVQVIEPSLVMNSPLEGSFLENLGNLGRAT